jgi:hypothetical protein
VREPQPANSLCASTSSGRSKPAARHRSRTSEVPLSGTDLGAMVRAMRRGALLSALCFVVPFALRCGGTTTATIADAGDPAADQACTASAAAHCARIDTCANIVVAYAYGDLATCEARLKANCMAALAAPSTGNTPAAVESCAHALRANVDCEGYFNDRTPSECQTKKGSLPDGAPCAFPAQCASARCAVASDAVCGTCGGDAAAAGQSCASSSCADGLACSRISNVCGAPAGVAASCEVAPCRAGLQCVGQVGARTCVTIVSTAAAGGVCGAMGDGRVVCAAEGTCHIATGQSTGTCTASAADGAACAASKGLNCLPPARCVGGTCRLSGADSCSRL